VGCTRLEAIRASGVTSPAEPLGHRHRRARDRTQALDVRRGCGEQPDRLAAWSFGTHAAIGGFPVGVAVGKSGQVYVADPERGRILRFSPKGKLLGAFGSGSLAAPSGVAVDRAGNVYVADALNQRVRKFSATGTPLTSWTTPSTGKQGTSSPRAVAVDGAGHIFAAGACNDPCAEDGQDVLVELASDGSVMQVWTGWSVSGPIGTNAPWATVNALAVDSSNHLYVAGMFAQKGGKLTPGVLQVSPTGAFHTEWTVPGKSAIQGIAVGPGGTVYVTSPDERTVLALQR
jgi:sugar lactone lactonase YvrE